LGPDIQAQFLNGHVFIRFKMEYRSASWAAMWKFDSYAYYKLLYVENKKLIYYTYSKCLNLKKESEFDEDRTQ
jgi:hypothetical protein